MIEDIEDIAESQHLAVGFCPAAISRNGYCCWLSPQSAQLLCGPVTFGSSKVYKRHQLLSNFNRWSSLSQRTNNFNPRISKSYQIRNLLPTTSNTASHLDTQTLRSSKMLLLHIIPSPLSASHKADPSSTHGPRTCSFNQNGDQPCCESRHCHHLDGRDNSGEDGLEDYNEAR